MHWQDCLFHIYLNQWIPIMDSDENRQSGVCHFSRLFLVSFLSMAVAIIIVRKTQELKQLEECMMENRLIRKTEPKYLEQCIKIVKSHKAAIHSSYQIKNNQFMNDIISVVRRYF